MKKFDHIIIGQGLAGSILAYTLIEDYKQKVLVIDNDHHRSSSKIAAGIYNPITGKRRVKTWMANELFPFMFDFYKRVEKQTGSKLLYDHKVYRPFDTIAEQNQWTAQTADELYKDVEIIPQSKQEFAGILDDKFGGIELSNSGWLDCEVFLQAIKDYLITKESYFIEKIEEIEVSNLLMECNQNVIFCEGFHAAKNPLWSWMPWLLAKGEILKIKLDLPQIKNVLNKSVFICPTFVESEYRVGSTFEWENLETDDVSETAKNELITKLGSFFSTNYQITGQQAGVRPTVQDRRPFIGVHPENERLAIFNGFGSKSVSMAPYFADHFAKYLVKKEALMPKVDIKRFK